MENIHNNKDYLVASPITIVNNSQNSYAPNMGPY